MPKYKNTQHMKIKCHAAAYHFSRGITSAEALAEVLGVTHESVRRWARCKDFHNALDKLGYTGKRTFSRKRRDVSNESDFDIAVALYKKLADENVPKHKRITKIVDRFDGRHSWGKLRHWIRVKSNLD